MGFLSKKTNKKFDYKPRYYGGDSNPYQIEHKFDQFRTTVGNDKSMKGKFKTAFEELKSKEARGNNRMLLIIIAVLVLIFLYIIDFDLSIFKISQ